MRISLALLLAAGLTGGAFTLQTSAQPAAPQPAPGAQPGAQPGAEPSGGGPKLVGVRPKIGPATPAQPEAQPIQSIAHEPVPVPDGPVVKKTELEGGLIVEDIKIGDGYEVKEGATVVAFYHGTLKADGTTFDSAFDRGEPAVFSLSGPIISGWTKGVPGMKVGGIRKLTVPGALGYGAAGRGQSIPPNSDLVFVIQLTDALQVEDIKVGQGDAATSACVAVTTQVVKDKDGKEIERYDAPKYYIWLPGEFPPMQAGLEGMKVGGKRKLIIPKETNKPNPALTTVRPAGVPLTIEFELVGLRNLPQRPPSR